MKDFFDTWKFKILVAVAVFLVGIMAYAGANGRLTAAPQELLSVVLTPFQKVTSALSGGIGSVWEKYTSIDDVMAQNDKLAAENAELRQQMVDYDSIKAENEAYKALTRIQDTNSEASYVSGFVIGRDPLDEFGGFTLDCGTVNGVAVSDAVISDKGYLVGVVVEADTTSCKVMTVLHPSFNAAGVVSRTRENGILTGSTDYAGDGLCVLTNLERAAETQMGDQVITTFDIRMTRPNYEPVMNTAEVHTIEHLAATWLRNNEEWKDRVLYFGPMGCRTGFYLLLAGDLTSEEIVPLMKGLFTFMRDYKDEVPGACAKDCGNYLDMNLPMANWLADRFLREVLDGIGPERLVYPE